MQPYLADSHVKVFIKPQEKPFDVIKTTNTGIHHDRQYVIYNWTFCQTVLEKVFQGLVTRVASPNLHLIIPYLLKDQGFFSAC